jgi:glucoside 3-dehydrogenase (cytochrome c) hitch-hiker subunit
VLLRRRELLKLLAIGSALPALPSPLLAACSEVHASLAETPALRILSPHQDATVTAMAELLIPRTDTPGAKDTHVNLFIDHIVADWYSEEERAVFLAGLADVDSRTQSLFQNNFVGASAAQQSEILRSLGDELAEAVDAVANNPRGYRGSPPQPENNFYLQFRELTLTGYFTSEAGFTQQLHEEIIPGRFDGCTPLDAAAQTKGS